MTVILSKFTALNGLKSTIGRGSVGSTIKFQTNAISVTFNPAVKPLHHSFKKFFRSVAFVKPDYKALMKEMLLVEGISTTQERIDDKF